MNVGLGGCEPRNQIKKPSSNEGSFLLLWAGMKLDHLAATVQPRRRDTSWGRDIAAVDPFCGLEDARFCVV